MDKHNMSIYYEAPRRGAGVREGERERERELDEAQYAC